MSKLSLEEAIDLVGGQTDLASKIREWHEANGTDCRVQQAHIWKWLNKQNGEVPAGHVIATSWATGWKKRPHDFRPDLYPNNDDGLPEAMRHVA